MVPSIKRIASTSPLTPIVVQSQPTPNTSLIHPRELEYLRVTSLKTFELCPGTWAAKYLTPASDEEEERTGFAAIGTAVHAICEDTLMTLHMPGYESNDNTILDAWKLVPENETANLTKYLQSLIELPVVQPLAIEDRLYYRMRDDAPPISGQMDFIYVTTDNDLVILDHKTNRGYSPAEWWKVQLQPLFYMWMIRQEYPGYRNYIFRIGYPNIGNSVQWVTDRTDDDTLELRFDVIWAKMCEYASAGVYPRTINDECNWCAVKDICPERHAAVNKFTESFRSKVGDKSTAEKLQYIKDVEKIVKAMRSTLEDELAHQVTDAGGKLTSGDQQWTLETSYTRRAEFVPTLTALNQLASERPQLAAQIQAMAAEIFTVKVGGLDAVTKLVPEFGETVVRIAPKIAADKPTLKATPIKKAITK